MQVRGRFREPTMLARSLIRDPAIFAAALNRIAPHRGLKRKIGCPLKLTGTAAAILEEARLNFEGDTSSALTPGLLADDFDRLAIHGIAVDQIYWEVRPDGSRMDPFVKPWPMEALDFFEIPPDGTGEPGLFAFTAATKGLDANGNTTYDGGGWIRVVHGDGRWIVHSKNADRPWAKGALVALGELWVELRFGRQYRSRNAESHGDDKWIGTLPPGMMPGDENGKAMLEELAKLYEPRRAMVIPADSTVKRDEALGSNWQIFGGLLGDGTKDAQRILLGQDGSMTNTGGNYVKAWGLFGVRNDIIESDVSTIGAGHATGLIRPWSIINFNRWDMLTYGWLIPDADEDARLGSIATRRAAFWLDVAAAKMNGGKVDQGYFDKLAATYQIDSPPFAEAVAVAPALDHPPAPTAHRQPLLAAVPG